MYNLKAAEADIFVVVVVVFEVWKRRGKRNDLVEIVLKSDNTICCVEDKKLDR